MLSSIESQKFRVKCIVEMNNTTKKVVPCAPTPQDKLKCFIEKLTPTEEIKNMMTAIAYLKMSRDSLDFQTDTSLYMFAHLVVSTYNDGFYNKSELGQPIYDFLPADSITRQTTLDIQCNEEHFTTFDWYTPDTLVSIRAKNTSPETMRLVFPLAKIEQTQDKQKKKKSTIWDTLEILPNTEHTYVVPFKNCCGCKKEEHSHRCNTCNQFYFCKSEECVVACANIRCKKFVSSEFIRPSDYHWNVFDVLSRKNTINNNITSVEKYLKQSLAAQCPNVWNQIPFKYRYAFVSSSPFICESREHMTIHSSKYNLWTQPNEQESVFFDFEKKRIRVALESQKLSGKRHPRIKYVRAAFNELSLSDFVPSTSNVVGEEKPLPFVGYDREVLKHCVTGSETLQELFFQGKTMRQRLKERKQKLRLVNEARKRVVNQILQKEFDILDQLVVDMEKEMLEEGFTQERADEEIAGEMQSTKFRQYRKKVRDTLNRVSKKVYVDLCRAGENADIEAPEFKLDIPEYEKFTEHIETFMKCRNNTDLERDQADFYGPIKNLVSETLAKHLQVPTELKVALTARVVSFLITTASGITALVDAINSGASSLKIFLHVLSLTSIIIDVITSTLAIMKIYTMFSSLEANLNAAVQTFSLSLVHMLKVNDIVGDDVIKVLCEQQDIKEVLIAPDRFQLNLMEQDVENRGIHLKTLYETHRQNFGEDAKIIIRQLLQFRDVSFDMTSGTYVSWFDVKKLLEGNYTDGVTKDVAERYVKNVTTACYILSDYAYNNLTHWLQIHMDKDFINTWKILRSRLDMLHPHVSKCRESLKRQFTQVVTLFRILNVPMITRNPFVKTQVDSEVSFTPSNKKIFDPGFVITNQVKLRFIPPDCDQADMMGFGWDKIFTCVAALSSIGITVWDSYKPESAIGKKLVIGSNVSKAIKENMNNTWDFAQDISYDCFGYALGNKHHTRDVATSTMNDLLKLLETNNSIYCQNPSLYFELQRKISGARSFITSMGNKLTERTAGEALTCSEIQRLLISSEKKLSELEHVMSSLGTRAETRAVVLYGLPGCGKTDFNSKYLTPTICARRGWSGSAYDISFNDHGNSFFKEYAYQQIAKVDEFLKLGVHDKLLPKLQELLSSNSYNMEGAFNKHQPCHIKLMTMTSNYANIDIQGNPYGITETTMDAICGRIDWINVMNENQWDGDVAKTTGRRDIGHTRSYDELRFFQYRFPNHNPCAANRILENLKTTAPKFDKQEAHTLNGSDFVKNTVQLPVYRKGVWYKMTDNQKPFYCKEITKEQLVDHCNSLIDETTADYDTFLKEHCTRLVASEINMNPNISYESLLEKCRFQGITDAVFQAEIQSGRVPGFLGVQQAKMNTTNHVQILICGAPGAGKTYSANIQILPALHRALGHLPVKHVACEKDLDSITKPSIITIEDQITEDKGAKWINWMQRIPGPSILIYTDNIRVVRKSLSYVNIDKCAETINDIFWYVRPMAYWFKVLSDGSPVNIVRNFRDGKLVPLDEMCEGWFRRIGIEGYTMSEGEYDRCHNSTSYVRYFFTLLLLLALLVLFLIPQYWYIVLAAFIFVLFIVPFLWQPHATPTPYISPDYSRSYFMDIRENFIDRDGKNHTVNDVTTEIYNMYTAAKVQFEDIKIERSEVSVYQDDADVIVHAPTMKELPRFINDRRRVMESIASPVNGCQVIISDRVKQCAFATCIREFRLEEDPTEDQVINMAKRTYSSLSAGSIDFTVSVKCADLEVRGANGVITYMLGAELGGTFWVHDYREADLSAPARIVSTKYYGAEVLKVVSITIEDLARFYCGRYTGEIDIELATEYTSHKHLLSSKAPIEHRQNLLEAKVLSGSEIMNDLEEQRKKWESLSNSVYRNISLALMGIVTLTGLLTSIYVLCSVGSDDAGDPAVVRAKLKAMDRDQEKIPIVITDDGKQRNFEAVLKCKEFYDVKITLSQGLGKVAKSTIIDNVRNHLCTKFSFKNSYLDPFVFDVCETVDNYNQSKQSYWHTHTCNYCNQKYRHEHFYKNSNHTQYAYQCPYSDCSNFYGRGDDFQQINVTKSMCLDEEQVLYPKPRMTNFDSTFPCKFFNHKGEKVAAQKVMTLYMSCPRYEGENTDNVIFINFPMSYEYEGAKIDQIQYVQPADANVPPYITVNNKKIKPHNLDNFITSIFEYFSYIGLMEYDGRTDLKYPEPSILQSFEKKASKQKSRRRLIERFQDILLCNLLALELDLEDVQQSRVRSISKTTGTSTILINVNADQEQSVNLLTPLNPLPTSLTNIRDIAIRNMCAISNDKLFIAQYGIGICDRYVLCNAHLFPQAYGGVEEHSATITLDNPQEPGQLLRIPCKIHHIDRLNDICILKFADLKQNFRFKDIRKHFANDDDKQSVYSGIFVRPVDNSYHTVQVNLKVAKEPKTKTVIGLDGKERYFSGITMEANFTDTNFITQPGDCGLPYMVNINGRNGVGNYKIGGIHASGNQRLGTSTGLWTPKQSFEVYLREYTNDSEDLEVMQSSNLIHEHTSLIPYAIDKEIMQEDVPAYSDIEVVNELLTNEKNGYIPKYEWPLFKPNKFHYGEIEKSRLSLTGFINKFQGSWNGTHDHRLSPWYNILKSHGFDNPVTNTVFDVREVQDQSKLIKSTCGSTKSILLTQVAHYNIETEVHPLLLSMIDKYEPYLQERFDSMYASKYHRELTLSEAINGLYFVKDGIYGCLEGLDLRSSCGFYSSRYLHVSKRRDIYTIDQQLTDHFGPINGGRTMFKYGNSVAAVKMAARTNLKRTMALGNRWFAPLSKDAPKDELTTWNKVEIGKTRLFVAFDEADNIFGKRVLGTYMAIQKKRHLKGWCQVGIDARKEFHLLHKRALKLSNVGEGGDFKHWDKCLLVCVFKLVLRLLYRTITKQMDKDDKEKFSKFFKILQLDALHNYSFCDGLVYQRHGGMGSGWIGTASINSDINECYNQLCGIISMYLWNQDPRNTELKYAEPFTTILFSQTILYCYGDDKKLVIHPDLINLLNFDSIKHIFKYYFGLEYTNPDKSDGSYKVKPLEEIDFLSRAFYESPTKVIFPTLKESSILGMLFWCTSKAPDVLANTLQNARLEIELLPPERYEKFRIAFNEIVREFQRLHPFQARISFLPDYELTLLKVTSEILDV